MDYVRKNLNRQQYDTVKQSFQSSVFFSQRKKLFPILKIERENLISIAHGVETTGPFLQSLSNKSFKVMFHPR